MVETSHTPRQLKKILHFNHNNFLSRKHLAINWSGKLAGLYCSTVGKKNTRQVLSLSMWRCTAKPLEPFHHTHAIEANRLFCPKILPFCFRWVEYRQIISLKGYSSNSNSSLEQRRIPCSLGTEVVQSLRYARVEGILRFFTNWHLT